MNFNLIFPKLHNMPTNMIDERIPQSFNKQNLFKEAWKAIGQASLLFCLKLCCESAMFTQR